MAYEVVKRVMDFTVALLGLVLLAPLFALIALAILLDDGPPVFFLQERVGKGGRVFKLIKFRTMRPGAGLFVSENDPAITSVGRFLRRWSLDELPQLVNVLLGHMSLVGPRPALPYQVARYTPRQRRRLEVRPGITGWAQVRGRNSLSWPERIELDLEYIERRSLWFDLKVLFLTLPAVIKGEGLYKGAGEWEKDPIARRERNERKA